MEALFCRKSKCKRPGKPFANKFSLDKHEQNCSIDTSENVCVGKRRRTGGFENNNTENNFEPPTIFDGYCVCGSHHRDSFNLNRHKFSCPFIVPCSKDLQNMSYKILTILPEKEVNDLKNCIHVLSPGQKAKICLSAGICIPGFFPILINSNRAVHTSTWNDFGLTGSKGLKTLRDIVEDSPIKFEEAFLIILQNGEKLFVPPYLLIPPEERKDLHLAFESSIEEGFITISRSSSPDVEATTTSFGIFDFFDDTVGGDDDTGSGGDGTGGGDDTGRGGYGNDVGEGVDSVDGAGGDEGGGC